MKQRKLTTRFVVVVLILILAAFFLYPTFRYEKIRSEEENSANWIAQQMGVSYAYVIENLYKDESILRSRLAEIEDLSPEDRAAIEERLIHLQGELQENALQYRKKAIKRGLDLQGGMHLVLEVDFVQLMSNISRQREDPQLKNLLIQIDDELNANPKADFEKIVTSTFAKDSLKLSRFFGEPGESDAAILKMLNEESKDAINRSLEILRNRIDQFGVSEPSIQQQGGRRIVMELPGIQDPARARDLIGRTALLEFKLLAEGENAQTLLEDIDKYIVSKEPKTPSTEGETGIDFPDEESDISLEDQPVSEETGETDTDETAAVTDSATDEAALDLSAGIDDAEAGTTETDTGAVAFEDVERPFSSLLRGFRGDVAVPQENIVKVREILADPEVKKLLPEGTEILWAAKPEIVGNQKFNVFYLLNANAELTGTALSDARVDISSGYNNPGTAGQPVVSITMNRKGARKFARVTGANVEKRLAIVLDEKVYMAPVLRTKIPDGRAVIEGITDVDEAEDLAIILRAGALPTSVFIEEERTVGPSLGRDSISKGQSSVIIGILLVIIFMAVYYGMSGLIANLALLLNIVLIFAGLAFFGAMGMGATLSLPGIAGIILTIGMAVDANVLIFERIREELATGKTVWHAISAGYDRAFTTILDANVTTLIAALVLLQFGTGPIRGFAVTLSIGIVCSLFTAIIVTRLIFDYITSRRTLTRLSI